MTARLSEKLEPKGISISQLSWYSAQRESIHRAWVIIGPGRGLSLDPRPFALRRH